METTTAERERNKALRQAKNLRARCTALEGELREVMRKVRLPESMKKSISDALNRGVA